MRRHRAWGATQQRQSPFPVGAGISGRRRTILDLALAPWKAGRVAHWWVNQKQTYRHEVPGGYLWSPKRRSNGQRDAGYDRMMLIQPGDVVFSYADGAIKAVGVALTDVQHSPKPIEFGTAGRSWDNDGWLVEVGFRELEQPFKPKPYMDRLGPLLPKTGSPLQRNGNGIQAYLFSVSEELAAVLVELIGPEFHGAISGTIALSDELKADDDAQRALESRTDLGAVERAQLIRARRGQGLFRIGVHAVEPVCRVTGVSDRGMLIASHIKPWRLADDSEKLDPNNGLMLSPHIDHLFDDGYISFTARGEMDISPQLNREVLTRWHIPERLNVGTFNSAQREYLGFHAERIFRASA